MVTKYVIYILEKNYGRIFLSKNVNRTFIVYTQKYK